MRSRGGRASVRIALGGIMMLGGSLFAYALQNPQGPWRHAMYFAEEIVVPPPPVAPLADEQGWAIQVGAYLLADTAALQLKMMAQDQADLLTGAQPIVEPVDMPGGVRLYRARFGLFTRRQAEDLCARLAARDQSCVSMTQNALPAPADAAPDVARNSLPEESGPSGAVQIARVDRLKSLDDAALSDMRGGFFMAGGVQFDFGASVRALVNGQLALQSTLQWTQDGPVTQSVAGPGTIPVPAFQLADLFGGSAGASGVSVPASSGSTTILANFAANQVQNVLLNTASNRTVTQNTDVTLTIYNMPQLQQQIGQQLLASRLINDVAAAGLTISR